MPPAVRDQRQVLHRYERVCFDRQFIEPAPRADLIAPGHPLLDAVVQAVTERFADALGQGTIFCDRTDRAEAPRLLVSVRQEVTDGHEPPRPVLKRFSYVELNPDGQPRYRTVEAPYLDYDALTSAEFDLVGPLQAEPWIADAPKLALAWAAGTDLPRQVAALQQRISADVAGPGGW